MITAKMWHWAGIILVLLLISNPELVELAILIDTVGLEVFLLALQVQCLDLLRRSYLRFIQPVLSLLWPNYRENFQYMALLWRQPDRLILYCPSPALMMLAIVASAMLTVLV